MRITFLTFAFLLTLGPLITEGLKISKSEIHLRDALIKENKIDYLKRDLSIRVSPGSDSSIRGTNDETHNKLIENAELFNAKRQSKPNPNNEISGKKRTQTSESKYNELAIVCSVCAVIVLSIGLTVLYIHYRKGNK